MRPLRLLLFLKRILLSTSVSSSIFFLIFFFLIFNAGAQAPKLRLPIGHTGTLNTIAFSSDFQRVLTASEDYSAKVWDANTGLLLLDLKGHTGAVKTAQFSHDNNLIVTASRDNTAIIWDAHTGKHVLDLPLQGLGLRRASFSPDDKTILTVCIDNTIKMWEVKTGKMLFSVAAGNDEVNAKFSPDGKKVFAFSSAPLKIIDASTGTLINELKADTSINMIDFSPDGKKFATATGFGKLTVFDYGKASAIFSFADDNAWKSDVKFLNKGTKVVTASDDGQIKIWDASTGLSVADLDNGPVKVRSIEISNDDKMLIAVTSAGGARVWDIDGKKLVREITIGGNDITVTAFGQNKDVLIGGGNGLAQLWDAMSGKTKTIFRGYSVAATRGAYSNNGKVIAIGYENGTTRLWDAKTGIPLRSLESASEVQSVAFSSDDKKILAALDNGTVNVWDAETGKILAQLYKDSISKIDGVKCMAIFSGDSKSVYTARIDDKVVKIWDVESGKVLRTLFQNTDNIMCMSISPDYSKIVTGSMDGRSLTWDSKNGTWLSLRSWPGEQVTSVSFLPNSTDVIAGMQNRVVMFIPGVGEISRYKVFNPVTDAMVSHDNKCLLILQDGMEPQLLHPENKTFSGLLGNTKRADNWVQSRQDNNCLTAKFSQDSQVILTGWGDGTIKFFSAEGTLIKQVREHDEAVNQTIFSPDSKRALTVSYDHMVKLWDGKTGNLISSSCVINQSDYLIEIPSGYYQCTPGAAKRLQYVTPDLKVLTFGQLDIKFNRPDKVLQAISSADTALIGAYHQAYLKRIVKLKIDTNAFNNNNSVPEADFKNRHQIKYQQAQNKLSLNIVGKDSLNLLNRFNIWVNQVPLYGVNGISIKQQQSKTLNITENITLSEGENRIETSIINVNGTESFHVPLYVNYHAAVPTPKKLYFVGIGTDKFTNSEYDLKWSVQDIRDLATRIKAKFGNGCIIDTLFNKNVTTENVKALKKKLQLTGIEDKVIIAYSGHGLFSKTYDYYLSSYNVNFNKPEDNGIPYDALEDLLDNIPARKKLMLVDACNSGEIDKDAAIKTADAPKSDIDPGQLLVSTKIDEDDKQKNGGVSDQRFFELMEQLFVNVGRNTGSTIISASAGTQFAHSEGSLKNGVFTYSILEYLKNDHCSISALKDYVNKRVPELTDGMQSPTTRTETDAIDWSLW